MNLGPCGYKPHALTNRANVPRVGRFPRPSSVFAPFPATEYNKGGSPFRPNLCQNTSVFHEHLIPDARDFDASLGDKPKSFQELWCQGRDSNPHGHRAERFSYHYSFRYRFRVCGLDFAFIRSGWRVSSLYTFPFGLGSALP